MRDTRARVRPMVENGNAQRRHRRRRGGAADRCSVDGFALVYVTGVAPQLSPVLTRVPPVSRELATGLVRVTGGALQLASRDDGASRVADGLGDRKAIAVVPNRLVTEPLPV